MPAAKSPSLLPAPPLPASGIDLHEWLVRMKAYEPKLINAVSQSVNELVMEQMPRIKGYALDSGGYKVRMEMSLEFDFNDLKPSVVIEGVVVPPKVGSKIEFSL